jgi:hypothetical protein
MSRNQAIETVLKREREGDLWTRDVLGFPVWPLERLRAYRSELLADHPGAALASSQPRGWARVRAELGTVGASMRDMTARSRREGRDIWVLSSSGYRRGDDGEGPGCIFAEHLRQQLGPRLLFVEFNTGRLPSLDRDDVCFVDAMQIPMLAGARASAPILSKVLGRQQREAMAALAPIPAARCVDRAVYGSALRSAAHRWITRARPAAVFVLDSYGMFVPAQYAVKERGIPLIELQHGLIHDSHPGYVMPDLPPGPATPLPDHLVCFGRHFGRTLDGASPYWSGRWSVGGHPWLQARVAEGERTPDLGVVLFGQYDRPVQERIAELATRVRRELPADVPVVIKPHPREADCEAIYRAALEAGAQLARPREDSYALLGRCQVAVSVFSTIAVEALAFPCRSAVVRSPYWSEPIVDLVDQGLLDPVEDAAGIVELFSRSGAITPRGDVARDLFGVGEPPPDFDQLIEDCRETLSRRSP